jgi:hypothetical protein
MTVVYEEFHYEKRGSPIVAVGVCDTDGLGVEVFLDAFEAAFTSRSSSSSISSWSG